MKRFREKRKEKLYRQWAEHSELPPEAIPQKEAPTNKGAQNEEAPPDKSTWHFELHFNPIYILLGACIILLLAVLIFLIAQSC